jgi:hypothetical protein
MRRLGGIPLWSLLAAMIVLQAFCNPPFSAKADPQGGGPMGPALIEKGDKHMPVLQLNVTPKRSEILVDESLHVDIELRNNGPTPIDLPSPDEPTVFEFTLRSRIDPNIAFTLRNENATALALNEPLPTQKVVTVEVNPGAALTYHDDISRFAAFSIPPDQYLLFAGYDVEGERVDSSGSPITIVAPKLAAMAMSVCPLGSNQVIAHLAAPTGVLVFQRASSTKSFDERLWYRRIEIANQAAVTGVAATFALAGDPMLRGVWWFGWLEGESVGAGVGQADTLFARVDPVALGLAAPVLHPVSWQPSNETATFVALGKDTQGRIALAAATFLATGSAESKAVPLANATLPARWVARARQEGEGLRFDVVTVDETTGAVRLLRQGVAPESGVADPPVVLTERKEPLVALGLYPIAGTEPGVVDALFGPAGDPPQMIFLRLPLDGALPIVEFPLSIPLDVNNQPPMNWALTPMPMSEPVVLAKFGYRLLAWRLSADSRWFVLAEGASQADHLQLEVIGDTVWAIWADPAIGIQYKAIP